MIDERLPTRCLQPGISNTNNRSYDMCTTKRFWTLLLLLIVSVSNAKDAKLYTLNQDGVAREHNAFVKLQRDKGGPGLLLIALDGIDPRDFVSMSEYAAQVRSAEAKSKPGAAPCFVCASPGRTEPRLIGIPPGKHRLSVLFKLSDIDKKLMTNKIAAGLAEKFPPEVTDENRSNNPLGENVHLVIIKHYEELSFEAEPGKYYSITYSWNNEARQLQLVVNQCMANWKECTQIAFESEKTQTKVLPGLSNEEI